MNDEVKFIIKEKDKYINELLGKIEDLNTILKNKNEQIENERQRADEAFDDSEDFKEECDFWIGKYNEIEKRLSEYEEL